ncbi:MULTISPECIES: cysteine-rich CWC family protein [Marinomonas]|uniref:cysteine-rich CWC family protein n=1 Tax=Marinomonas TaxID=28253 RepID=UPI0010544ADB|nr:cysteine-rich CWC family protein [Marinomonas sp. KMM3893]
MMNCPFCSASNLCDRDGECWCFVVAVPASLLSLLPESSVGRDCICQSCLERYKSDPDAFVIEYKARV